MASPGAGGKLSFERDIKPLFRTKDRDSMLAAFDLFDYDGCRRARRRYRRLPAQRADAVRRRVARIPGGEAPAVD